MTIKLLTKQHLEFLRLKGGCTGSSESTLVKMPQKWKSHVAAHFKGKHSELTLEATNFYQLNRSYKWPLFIFNFLTKRE